MLPFVTNTLQNYEQKSSRSMLNARQAFDELGYPLLEVYLLLRLSKNNNGEEEITELTAPG